MQNKNKKLTDRFELRLQVVSDNTLSLHLSERRRLNVHYITPD